MIDNKGFNLYEYFLGFICGFIVAIFTLQFVFASDSSVSDFSYDNDFLLELSSLECPEPDTTYNVSSDRYLVFSFRNRLGEYTCVWFISDYGTFRFVDRDSTKDLVCNDGRGKCYVLDRNAQIIGEHTLYTYQTYFKPENIIPDVFNLDRSDIVFLYSTENISTYYIETENRTTEIYIPKGYNPSLEFSSSGGPSSRPSDSNTSIPVDHDEAEITLLKRILDALLWFPDYLLDGIKEIFSGLLVPDSEEIQADINGLQESIFDSMGFDLEELKLTLSNMNAEAIQDIYIDLEIAGKTQTVKVLDTKFLVIGIDYFRPILRAFLELMLFFFVLNQVAHLIHIDGFTNKGGGEK